MMQENDIVISIVDQLQTMGYKVATEIANLYRSADIAAIDTDGNVCVIECKISSISRAIIQSKTHKLTADKVYIGTPLRKTQKDTIDRIKEAGVGLIYVLPDGSIKKEFDAPDDNNPWKPAQEKLIKRILEAV